MHPMLTVRQYGAMALRTSYADDPSDAQSLNNEWSDVIRHHRRSSCICYFLTAPNRPARHLSVLVTRPIAPVPRRPAHALGGIRPPRILDHPL